MTAPDDRLSPRAALAVWALVSLAGWGLITLGLWGLS